MSDKRNKKGTANSMKRENPIEKSVAKKKSTEKVQTKPGPMLYPLPVVMVSVGNMNNSNIITIAWTGTINSDPPMLSISVKKCRHSHDIIEKSGEFVVNLVSEDIVKETDFAGVKSGRDLDKFDKLGLKKIEASEVSAPMIAEAPVNLECKVKQVIELPSHDMFIAEVVAVHVDEKYVGEDGAYQYDKMNLVTYNHGSYYRVGSKPLGKFGYSIMKKKTAKRIRAAKMNDKRNTKKNTKKSTKRTANK